MLFLGGRKMACVLDLDAVAWRHGELKKKRTRVSELSQLSGCKDKQKNTGWSDEWNEEMDLDKYRGLLDYGRWIERKKQTETLCLTIVEVSSPVPLRRKITTTTAALANRLRSENGGTTLLSELQVPSVRGLTARCSYCKKNRFHNPT